MSALVRTAPRQAQRRAPTRLASVDAAQSRRSPSRRAHSGRRAAPARPRPARYRLDSASKVYDESAIACKVAGGRRSVLCQSQSGRLLERRVMPAGIPVQTQRRRQTSNPLALVRTRTLGRDKAPLRIVADSSRDVRWLPSSAIRLDSTRLGSTSGSARGC